MQPQRTLSGALLGLKTCVWAHLALIWIVWYTFAASRFFRFWWRPRIRGNFQPAIMDFGVFLYMSLLLVQNINTIHQQDLSHLMLPFVLKCRCVSSFATASPMQFSVAGKAKQGNQKVAFFSSVVGLP